MRFKLFTKAYVPSNPNPLPDPVVYLHGGPGFNSLGTLTAIPGNFNWILSNRDLYEDFVWVAHGVYGAGHLPLCLKVIVKSFLENPTMTPDAACLSKPEIFLFNGMGWNKPNRIRSFVKHEEPLLRGNRYATTNKH
jgi:hypothetical protein